MAEKVFKLVFRERGVRNFMDPNPDYDVILNDVIVGSLSNVQDGLSGYITDHTGKHHDNGGKSAPLSFWKKISGEMEKRGEEAIQASRSEKEFVQHYHQTWDPLIIRLSCRKKEKIVLTQCFRIAVIIFGAPDLVPWGFCEDIPEDYVPDKPTPESVARFLIERISTSSIATMSFLNEVSIGNVPHLSHIDKNKIRKVLNEPTDNEAVAALSTWLISWMDSTYVMSLGEYLDMFLDEIDKNNIWADKRFSRSGSDLIKGSAERIQEAVMLLRGMRSAPEWKFPAHNLLAPKAALPLLREILRLSSGMGRDGPLVRVDKKLVGIFTQVRSLSD